MDIHKEGVILTVDPVLGIYNKKNMIFNTWKNNPAKP
jgi:hypothetical protein